MSDIEYSVITSDVIKSFDCIAINSNFAPVILQFNLELIHTLYQVVKS